MTERQHSVLESGDTARFDEQAIDDVERGLGLAATREIVAAFFNDTEARLGRIAASHDTSTIWREALSLSSLAATMGAITLGMDAKKIALAANEGCMPDPAAFGRLALGLAQARNQLGRRFG